MIVLYILKTFFILSFSVPKLILRHEFITPLLQSDGKMGDRLITPAR